MDLAYTHLALHFDQHLAFDMDLFLDGIVDIKQNTFTVLAALRQSMEKLDFPLISQLLPLPVSVLQLFVSGLLPSNHLLLQLLQSEDRRIEKGYDIEGK